MTDRQNDFQKMVVYQIYPRSFKDSDLDGIGDINGITEKLDYIKSLGANAIWLSPCYKSPNEDNGYDISDYRDIMDEFGTLDDWKRMTAEIHRRGMKLIMDLVANHTSSEHMWFKEARKSGDNPYRDYYYWADKPLNDWQACFGGSAWQYDEATNQYYLHSYAVGQPDLNWENPKVRQEMIDVVDYWVKLGVDGFRCDVLDQISKDFVNNENRNGPRLHEYIKMLFGRDEVAHIFTVGECWGAGEGNIKQLIGAERKELSTVFQFDHITVGYGNGGRFDPVPFSLDEMRDRLIKWQIFMQENDLTATLFLENHDQPRCVSRFGNDTGRRYESATMLATMIYLQKGIPFIYQGQEIGTANPYSDNIEDYDDIETVNFYKRNKGKLTDEELFAKMNFGTRDAARRPMAWDDSENSGFGGKPWLPVYNRYKEINVKTDLTSEKSVFGYYRELLKLRTENEAFITGAYENVTENRKGIYIYKRYTADECFIVVCNFENSNELRLDIDCKAVLTNCKRDKISGIYKPYECAVFKVNKGVAK